MCPPAANGTSTPFSVTFAGLHQYSLFLVKRDSGVAFVYASFALIMAGLLIKLYLRPLLERRARLRRGAPITLDARWTSAVSGERAPDPEAEPLALPDGESAASGVAGVDRRG